VFHERLQEWCDPPGAEGFPSIVDFPVSPVARPDLVVRSTRDSGDCLSLYDPITLDAHSLNETASVLFRLCDGTRLVRTICSDYARILKIDGETARADVRRVLVELFEKRLLLTCRTRRFPTGFPSSFPKQLS
jgi:hypothetical protein